MKQKNILINFLLLGSLLISLCTMLCSCDTEKVDYVFHGSWLYENESSMDVEIKGIEDFSYPKELEIKIEKESSYVVIFDELGGKDEVEPTDFPMPEFTDDCRVIIDNKEYKIADGEFFRDINNYEIKKIGFNNYTFTYTFSDEVISDIISE